MRWRILLVSGLLICSAVASRAGGPAFIAGSSALISRTACEYCLISRSLRLPKMRVRIFEIIAVRGSRS